MKKKNWNEHQAYLLNTRKYFWNDDYLFFLVNHVWKIKNAVNIIDFGCGFGYLGLKLLPILPKGSTYTGIDIAEELLKTAKTLFKNLPYNYKFINADLMQYESTEKYDMAICQAVLRHIPQYNAVLKKMIDAVAINGKVVCIEINRRIENSGLYVSGDEQNIDRFDTEKMRQWQNELKNGGRDFLLGSKIPILMEEFGLSDVSVRVNDYVEYISPSQCDYDTHMKHFKKEHALEQDKNLYAVNMRGMLISFGTKQ